MFLLKTSFGLVLFLLASAVSCTPLDHDAHFERHPNTCGKVRDVLEALNKLPHAWKFCEEKLKPQTTTVQVTVVPTV